MTTFITLYIISLIVCTIAIKVENYVNNTTECEFAVAAIIPLINNIFAVIISVWCIYNSLMFLINWVPKKKVDVKKVEAEAEDFIERIRRR